MPIQVKPANSMCPAEQLEALNESVPANLRQSFDERRPVLYVLGVIPASMPIPAFQRQQDLAFARWRAY